MDEVAPQLPASEHARTEPPLPLMSPPINGATTAPVPSARASAPVMPSAPVPSAALVSREVLSQIVGCFSGVGSFESAVEHVAGSTIVSLIEPSLPREAVTTCAGHLLRCLAGASAEIVTLRTRHAVVVLAVAPTPIVSAARLPGAPVALLGMRALRAAASVVDGTLSLPTPPQRALELVSIDGQRAEVVRTLRSFGAVATTVFAEGTTRVYVASTGGGDDKALAALALNVCDALGDGGALGRPRAIVFRRGGQHTLVRPLTGRAGVLVVAGPVTRPGRLLGESDRAATVLEAL